MGKILYYLIYNSILASLLILFIFILRLIFKNKIDLKLQYGLWIIVVLRLILPPSLDLKLETKIIFPSVLNLSILNDAECYEKLDNNTQYLINTDTKIYGDIQDKQLKFNTKTWKTIIFILWISVALCTLAVFSISNLKFYKKNIKDIPYYNISRNTYDEIAKIAGLKTSIPIYLSLNLNSPCLMGIFNPKIILTENILSNIKATKFAIIHEMTHYKQKDNLFRLIGNFLCVLYWFNPLVWLATETAKNDAELCCDSRVLQKINPNEYFDYGNTLLLIASKKNIPFSAMSTSGKKISKRIYMILNPPQKRNITIFVFTISIIMGIISFINIEGSAQLLNENISLTNIYEVYELLNKIPNPNDNYKLNTIIINNTDKDRNTYNLAKGLSLIYEFSRDNSISDISDDDVQKINKNALNLFSNIFDLEAITISYVDKPANSIIRNEKAPITFIYKKNRIKMKEEISIDPQIDNSFWQIQGDNNVIIINGYSELYSKLGIEEKEFNKDSISVDDLISKLGPYKNSWKSGHDTMYRFSPNPIYKNWSDLMIIVNEFNNIKGHGIILSDLNN